MARFAGRTIGCRPVLSGSAHLRRLEPHPASATGAVFVVVIVTVEGVTLERIPSLTMSCATCVSGLIGDEDGLSDVWCRITRYSRLPEGLVNQSTR